MVIDWSAFIPNLIITIIQGIAIAIILKIWLDKMDEGKFKFKARKELLKFYKAIKNDDSQKINEILNFLDKNVSEYFQKYIRMRWDSINSLENFKFLIKTIQSESSVVIYDKFAQKRARVDTLGLTNQFFFSNRIGKDQDSYQLYHIKTIYFPSERVFSRVNTEIALQIYMHKQI